MKTVFRPLRVPAVLSLAALLGACAYLPTGPSVMALPGTGKSFDQFRADDGSCRQYAFEQSGGVHRHRPGKCHRWSSVRSARDPHLCRGSRRWWC